MELEFNAEDHSYKSINDPTKKWISVTTLISKFHEPFNAQEIALSCSNRKPKPNKPNKWYGLPPEKIIEIWNAESKRADELGTWYHNQREADVSSLETITREGLELPIFPPIYNADKKLSPDQCLVPGIYPEHFMYLNSYGVCGQSDRVEVIGDRVDIIDYKSNKKIDQQSYVNWEGKSKKMYTPVEHLDDCNLMHYALQLSLYMFIILKHNPQLKPGKLEIHHVTFEIESEDEFGFPTHKRDVDNNPIVKEVIVYKIPYLKTEVQNILTHLLTDLIK